MARETLTIDDRTRRAPSRADDPPPLDRQKDGASELRVYPSDRIGGGHRLALVRVNRPRPRTARRPVRALVVGVLSLLFLSSLMVLPLRWIDPPITAFMLQDDSGQETLLHEWSPWAEIGDAAAYAVVAAEDQAFPKHFGFDMISIRQSIDEFAGGESLRGASTVSQQLAKNLYLWPGKSFLRKGIEAYFTVLIEAILGKKRILEIYLNVAEFGPGIYGVGAASKAFFEKPPNELTDAEAALLAAVLPNPKRLHVAEPSAYVQERQGWIVAQMQRLRRDGWLDGL